MTTDKCNGSILPRREMQPFVRHCNPVFVRDILLSNCKSYCDTLPQGDIEKLLT